MLPVRPNVLQFPLSSRSSDDDLDELGTIAISRCSPANPAANVLTFLGELLSDGLPKLAGSGLKELRALGSKEVGKLLGHEYLNYEFGWKPFISDLRSIANLILTAEKQLRNFENNSGKLVRRRYEFPPDVSFSPEVKLNLVGSDPWINPSSDALYRRGVTPTGQVFYLDRIERRQWFSGAFTYYLPPADSLRNGIARYVIEARKLLGLSLTPDNVWALTPWSWAVDWFSDVHELLNNWTNWAIDNQVLAYGYMMEHSITQRTYNFVGTPTFVSGTVKPVPLTLVHESKIRRQATPFGFGLDWDDFTSTQTAIATSLGLTRRK